MPSSSNDQHKSGMSKARNLYLGALSTAHRILHAMWSGLKPGHGRKTIDDKKQGGMSKAQNLYPGAIYAVHRILHEKWPGLKPGHGRKTIVLIPSLFSKYSRSFHWLAIANDSWVFGQRKGFTFDEVLKELKGVAGSKETAWEEFCKNLPTEIPLFDKAAKYVDPLIKNKPSKADKRIFHQHLLTLYEGYRHDPVLYLDGIIYRNLEKLHENKNDEDENSQSLGVSYLLGSYTGEKGKTHNEYPWLDCTFYDMDGKRIYIANRFQCQEAKDEKDRIDDLYKPDKLYRHGWGVADFLLNNLFLDPVIKRVKEDSHGDDSGLEHFLILPIYDAWVGNEMFGALCGNLTLMFSSKMERRIFLGKKKLSKLREMTYLILRDLRHSALSLIASAPIQPPYDLIEHFVKNLRFLQDWERIVVYKKEGDVNIQQYCFKWSKNGDGNLEWKRFDYKNRSKTENGCKECEDKDNCHDWNSDDQRYRYLTIDAGELLDDFNIPNISSEEKEMYGSYMFAFEYPLTSVIPKDNDKPKDKDKREEVNALYKRQQIAVLQALIPKVRARRAALRNAAVSIMGRNMSHNIGSHVLARLQIDQGGGAEAACNFDEKGFVCNLPERIKAEKISNPISEAGKLVRFLQQRMDFIAEASTTQPYSSLPMFLYGDVLHEFGQQNLLLKHISGIGDLQAVVKVWCGANSTAPGSGSTVATTGGATGKESSGDFIALGPDMYDSDSENIKGSDIRFACTGGRAGMHALYVLIENIIRNSAKHGSGQQSWILKGELSTTESGEQVATYMLDIPKCPDPKAELWDINELKGDVRVYVADVETDSFFLDPDEEPPPKHDLDGLGGAIQASQEPSISTNITSGYCGGVPPELCLTLNGQEPGTVEIRIRVQDEACTKGRWGGRYREVLIWDLQRNGAELDTNGDEEDEKKPLYERINHILDEVALVEQDGSLNQKAWGIREMQIACAYLRGIALEDLEAPLDGEPKKILEACLVNDAGETDNGDAFNLGFRFYLEKVQDLLIVADNTDGELYKGASSHTDVECLSKGELAQAKNLKQEYCLWLPSEKPDGKELSKLPVRLLKESEAEEVISALQHKEELAQPLAKAWLEKRCTSATGDKLKLKLKYTEESQHVAETVSRADVEGWAINGPSEGDKEEATENAASSADGTKKIWLVFDDHGYIMQGNGSGSIEHHSDWEIDDGSKETDDRSEAPESRLKALETLGFYEPTRSSYPQTPMLKEENAVKGAVYKALFKAAALSRVLILDERIQLATKKPWDSSNCPLVDVLRLGRVFVPPKEACDLDKTTLKSDEIIEWLEQFDEGDPLHINHKKFDFIVIHQGIVEKLRKSDKAKDGEDQWLRDLVDQRSSSGRLVICSGRGSPRGLPDNARFLSLSGLLHTVTVQPSKLHLMLLLWASRAPKSSQQEGGER